MKSIIITIVFSCLFILPEYTHAIEKAERITDREIIESLISLKEGQAALNQRLEDGQAAMNKRLEEGMAAMDKRIDDTNRRIDDTNRRIDDLRLEMISRFSVMQWMFGIFITLALVILGFVLRLQWKMQSKQVEMESSLATQRDEIAFLKTLIEKLIPPQQTASKVLRP